MTMTGHKWLDKLLGRTTAPPKHPLADLLGSLPGIIDELKKEKEEKK